MDKFTKYEEVAERLNIFLRRTCILDEPDYPSLLKIKLAIENNYAGFNNINLIIRQLKDRLLKESRLKLFGEEINIEDFDIELDDNRSSITFYYRVLNQDVCRSVTLSKPKFENVTSEVTKITEPDIYVSKFLYQFFDKYKNLISQMFCILDNYKFAGQACILSEIPYDILKVSFVLNPYNVDNIIHVDVKPNEEYVEINHETMRAFKEIVPGNEENIIYSLVYQADKLIDELFQIYYANKTDIDVNEYRRRTLKNDMK